MTSCKAYEASGDSKNVFKLQLKLFCKVLEHGTSTQYNTSAHNSLSLSLSLCPGHGGWSKPPGIMPTRSGCALVPSISLSRRPRIAPCVVNSHEISVVRALPAALPAALEHAADRHPHNTSTRFQANYHLDRFRKSAASSSLLPVSTCSRNSSNNGAVPGLCFHCERAC